MVRATTAAVAAAAAMCAVRAAPVAVQVEEPRAYGHVVGDLVERRISIELPAGAELPPASLPRRGRVDVWFELRDVRWRSPAPGRTAGELHLVYQIVNAPPRQIATAELPPLSLKLRGGSGSGSSSGGEPVADVAAWPITVSALTPQAVLARAGLEALQGDVAPQRTAIAPIVARIALWAALLAVLAYALAVPRFPQLAFWRRRAPFRTAWSDVHRLARRRSDAETYRAALTRLHAAFDAAAGAAVFADRLEPLYDAQPALRGVSQQVQQFFAWSRGEFFAPTPEPASDSSDRARQMHALLALARRLAQAEAGA
jgi:mxaA protein